jgi:hypothetical protein
MIRALPKRPVAVLLTLVFLLLGVERAVGADHCGVHAGGDHPAAHHEAAGHAHPDSDPAPEGCSCPGTCHLVTAAVGPVVGFVAAPEIPSAGGALQAAASDRPLLLHLPHFLPFALAPPASI